MLALTAADERMLFWPVMAGFAAMIIVCVIGAAVQTYSQRDTTQQLQLPPRAARDPRSHVSPTAPTCRRPYDHTIDG